MEALVFDHITQKENVGKDMSLGEFLSFSTNIATKLLLDDGCFVESRFRLFSSNVACLVSKEKICVVPVAMYPEHAKLEENAKEEALSVARSIGKKLVSYPLSLASLSDNPSKATAGSSYLVKCGKLEELL